MSHHLFLVISVIICYSVLLQEDSALTDSRPGTAHAVGHVDPLAVDIEDLYVKYKVYFLLYFSVLVIKRQVHYRWLLCL